MSLYNLGDLTVTAALTDHVPTVSSLPAGTATAYVPLPDDVQSVALFAEFDYGSGGTTCLVMFETSLNDGSDWIEICRFDFATADAKKLANLSGLTPKGVTAVAALGAEGVLDGILGPRLRARVTSTGTYAGGTTLNLRAAVRRG